MSGHWITWEWDGYGVRGDVYCHEPIGADCRLAPEPSSDCDCEEFVIERAPDGRAYHVPDGGDDRHYMADGGECNFVLFLDDALPELGPRADSFTIGRTPITPVWSGDGGYEWERAQ